MKPTTEGEKGEDGQGEMVKKRKRGKGEDRRREE
jgi:hypothetical protein